jgi:hypothetical protein
MKHFLFDAKVGVSLQKYQKNEFTKNSHFHGGGGKQFTKILHSPPLNKLFLSCLVG